MVAVEEVTARCRKVSTGNAGPLDNVERARLHTCAVLLPRYRKASPGGEVWQYVSPKAVLSTKLVTSMTLVKLTLVSRGVHFSSQHMLCNPKCSVQHAFDTFQQWDSSEETLSSGLLLLYH